jgi:hypothetical protein
VSLPDITTNITSPTTLPVVLNQGYWTDYSSTCVAAGGSGGSNQQRCGGTQPEPNPTAVSGSPDALLFSWGAYNENDPRSGDEVNSFLEVEYQGTQAFRLDSLRLVSQPNLPLGPPNPNDNNPAGRGWSEDTGLGTMLAYEEILGARLLEYDPNNPPPHFITEQRVAMRVLAGGSRTAKAEVLDWKVAVPESVTDKDETTDFYDPGRGGFPDYRFTGGDAPDPTVGKTFFFTEKGGSLLGNRPTDTRTTVPILPGDILQFQFYEASTCGTGADESCWNNKVASRNEARKPPDAYYGSFDLILNPAAASELRVTPDDTLTLPNARAGDPTATTGSIQVENVGDGVIDGQFSALTGDTTEIGPSGTQSFSLDASGTATDQRDYTFDASGVIFDVSDAGSTGKTFTVTQDITSDADTNPNQTRTVEATAKSPILGVSDEASPDTTISADWLPYGSTIDLGTLNVGDDFFIRDLILGNLFGAVDGTLTELTFYNAAITATNGFFSIVSGSGMTSGETLQAAQTHGTPLQIRFDPDDTDIGTWTAQLDVRTDMYREHNVGQANASTLSFTLQATLRDAPVPVPGALALVGIGLVPLLAARRRSTAAAC